MKSSRKQNSSSREIMIMTISIIPKKMHRVDSSSVFLKIGSIVEGKGKGVAASVPAGVDEREVTAARDNSLPGGVFALTIICPESTNRNPMAIQKEKKKVTGNRMRYFGFRRSLGPSFIPRGRDTIRVAVNQYRNRIAVERIMERANECSYTHSVLLALPAPSDPTVPPSISKSGLKLE